MPKRHVLGMVLITAILAVCFALIKTGLAYAPPLLFGGLRAVIGGGALLGVAALARGPWIPPRRTFPGVLTLSVVATAITFAAMFLGPGLTETGVASAAGNLQPFITLLLAAFFLGEALTAAKYAAVLFGMIGITLISYPALSGADAPGVSGVALALTVSVGSSIGNVLIKRMQLGRSLLAVTAWQLVLGGLLLLVVSSQVEDVSRLDLNPAFVALLLFLALAGTALTTGLWYSLIEAGRVGQLATFFYLVPIFGLGIAALVYDEDVSLLTVGGAVALLLAVGAVAGESFMAPAERAETGFDGESAQRVPRLP